jgi:dipeptidyl aminopeptidase/acylaminoacyl peptidase
MNRHSARRRALLAAGACGPAFASTATFAQTAAANVPAARDFFRHPQIAGVSLSPDGRALAGVRLVNGRRNLMVVDLASRKSLIVTNFRDADVVAPRWISEQRIVFGLLDFTRGLGDQFGSGLFAIDKDAGSYRQLSERALVEERVNTGERMLSARTTFHSRAADAGLAGGRAGDDCFVQIWSDQGARRLSSVLRRLNTRTGVSTQVTVGGPGNVVHWVLDRSLVPRVAVSLDDGTRRVHLRDGEGAPWRVLAEYGFDSGDVVEPIAFDGAGTLYVVARNGRDLAGIHRVDPRMKSPAEAIEKEPVFSLRDYDLDGQLRFGPDFRVIGIDYEGERRGTHWLDKPWADLQALVDGALPGRVNRLTGDLGITDAPVLVFSYSDQDAGRYYLFDRTKKQLEQIAAVRPWLEPGRMAQTDVVHYKARDGLKIPAQITLPPPPKGGPRRNLPLVVMHYGGPWVRPFHWEFDPVVQFLASRGYAVLMPAPRASTGFGFRHFRAGWKQWGLAMQDDLTDGARWLIQQGLVDEKRVAFVGASYGGYAAMQALAKEPDLFRCAVNWIGLTDPAHMFSMTWTDFAALDAARLTLNVLLGDPERDADQFRATSPLANAARIRQPVLMAYGGLDKRVPIENGERMRAALAPHNRNVEWVVYGDEGHGWLKEENNVDFWVRVERFLGRHLAA